MAYDHPTLDYIPRHCSSVLISNPRRPKRLTYRFMVDDLAKATAGVECRKDAEIIDGTPTAYKSIDAVMEAQRDLVEVVHTLRPVVC